MLIGCEKIQTSVLVWHKAFRRQKKSPTLKKSWACQNENVLILSKSF